MSPSAAYQLLAEQLTAHGLDVPRIKDLLKAQQIETITDSDLEFRSPGDGVSPWMLPQLIGKKLKKAMLKEDSLRLEDVE